MDDAATEKNRKNEKTGFLTKLFKVGLIVFAIMTASIIGFAWFSGGQSNLQFDYEGFD